VTYGTEPSDSDFTNCLHLRDDSIQEDGTGSSDGGRSRQAVPMTFTKGSLLHCDSQGVSNAHCYRDIEEGKASRRFRADSDCSQRLRDHANGFPGREASANHRSRTENAGRGTDIRAALLCGLSHERDALAMVWPDSSRIVAIESRCSGSAPGNESFRVVDAQRADGRVGGGDADSRMRRCPVGADAAEPLFVAASGCASGEG
jgi:hypothetical protein